MRKPFIGNCAVEWQVGKLVMQFCHNDKFNWRENASGPWRFNFFLV